MKIPESRNIGVNHHWAYYQTANADTNKVVSCLTLETLCSLCVSPSTGGGSSSLEGSHSVSLNVCHGRRAVAFVSGAVVNYSGGGFSYLMLSWCDTVDDYRKIKMGRTCFSIPPHSPNLCALLQSFLTPPGNNIDLIRTEMGNGCHLSLPEGFNLVRCQICLCSHSSVWTKSLL